MLHQNFYVLLCSFSMEFPHYSSMCRGLSGMSGISGSSGIPTDSASSISLHQISSCRYLMFRSGPSLIVKTNSSQYLRYTLVPTNLVSTSPLALLLRLVTWGLLALHWVALRIFWILIFNIVVSTILVNFMLNDR